MNDMDQAYHDAARRVLRDPRNSKRAKVARGEALTQRRRRPRPSRRVRAWMPDAGIHPDDMRLERSPILWWPCRGSWWREVRRALRGWPIGQRSWIAGTRGYVEAIYLPLPWCWMDGYLKRDIAAGRAWMRWWWREVDRDISMDGALCAIIGIHWVVRAVRGAWFWWLRISWRCWQTPGKRTRPWPL